MTLTLTIKGVDRLDNGMPAEFVLNRRGAMIGRSPTCDWSLPDARNYISSRHCEVVFRDGFYLLNDVSTNGTFLNGQGERMPEARRIVQGDRFQVGQYEVVATLSGDAAVAIERDAEATRDAAQGPGWGGWDSHGGGADAPPPPPVDDGWGAPPAGNALSSSASWGGPPPTSGGAADWGAAPAPAPGPAWGSAPGTPEAASEWGAAPAPTPAASGGGSDWGAAPAATPGEGGWGAPPVDTGAAAAPGWAPRTGPSLARDPAHVASARGAAPSVPAPSFGGDWSPSAAAPPLPPVVSTWEAAAPQQQGASDWSSAAPDRPPAASPDDVWGKIADGNVVDWARGGFGQPVEEARDPLGLNKPAASAALPRAQPRMAQFDAGPAAGADPNAGWGAPAPSPADAAWAAPAAPTPPAAQPGWGATAPEASPLTVPPTAPVPARPPSAPRAAPPPAPAAAAAAAPGVDAAALVEAFALAAGLKPGQLKAPTAETLTRAGQLLKQLVSGLVVMVEARARAKSQMGAEATSLEFDGNNPIKFARAPEQAVAQLLNPKERGFMDADRAVEDAFYDLQSHQMATLKAMQGALRATLDRFSPTAIKARADSKGLLARIMPGAREAALWQAYEREFGGVAQGSDEAFMDMFAKEFRRAYEEQSAQRRSARR